MDFENQSQFRPAHDEDVGLASRSGEDRSAARAGELRSATIVPVILSGGGGSRLWPFSTEETPKQFLPLVGTKSMFRQALDRVGDRTRFTSPLVVASVRHADLCEQELRGELGNATLLLEPCPRNTAAAIVMAAAAVQDMHGPDALLLVMPSDHVIEDVALFYQAVRTGEAAARAGRLVTFGIVPTGPETGYGYLEMGADVPAAPGVRDVAKFIEKPELEAAQQFVSGGEHLWNAGIFLFKASTLLEEAGALAPAIREAAVQAVEAGSREGIRITADLASLAACPSDSIDYAVMEKSSKVAVVPTSPGWSDLGSWDAMAALAGTSVPRGPVTALDCDGSFILSDGLEVAALGVRDLIVVASGNRLLILPRGRSQEVKKLLSKMQEVA